MKAIGRFILAVTALVAGVSIGFTWTVQCFMWADNVADKFDTYPYRDYHDHNFVDMLHEHSLVGLGVVGWGVCMFGGIITGVWLYRRHFGRVS
jgi:uncharacterized protein YneF (UPF0154 family)